jgi:hypothetical protein
MPISKTPAVAPASPPTGDRIRPTGIHPTRGQIGFSTDDGYGTPAGSDFWLAENRHPQETGDVVSLFRQCFSKPNRTTQLFTMGWVDQTAVPQDDG